jgi:hypothetical protein
MAMFYFFPNKCWTSKSPICTPLGRHFLGVVELDHKNSRIVLLQAFF